MKRELGIARCGLACCLCAENEHCGGCHSEHCSGAGWCETRKCAIENGFSHCFVCSNTDCRKGLLSKMKPLAFTEFARKYGVEHLLDCLEQNEKNGVVYHRTGITGDYDGFESIEMLMKFIETGES